MTEMDMPLYELGAIEKKNPFVYPKRYEMWLTYNNGKEKLKFPMLPETVRVSYGQGTKSVDVIGLGEIVIMQDRPAITVAFDVVLPSGYASCLHVKTVQRPEALKKRLVRWKKSKMPCHFLITETGIKMDCVIADFSYTEVGGDKGSLYISMTLKEYRPIKIRKIQVAAGAASIESGAQRLDSRVPPNTHTVIVGDTLLSIARMNLGSEDRFTEILALNPQIVNPSLIPAGTVLRLS